jgi:glycerol kinase
MTIAKKDYILSLDQGTTSSRAVLFDHGGNIIGIARKELHQIYPEQGWVEHDPQEIWSGQMSVISEIMAKTSVNGKEIKGIGITNQRETTILWNRKTGIPVYNAIVWQDRRTAEHCDKLIVLGKQEFIQRKTGLIPDAYFSATKIRWILDNVKGVQKEAENGNICFGTVDSWLLWKLSSGKIHATDVTNASRTMLFNIHTMEWDNELLDLFAIPRSILPEVRSCSEIFGYTDPALTGFKVPVAGIAGDQQAALYGQMCFDEGMVKNTYGTGCFMIMNTGNKPVDSKNMLLTTIAWKIGNKINYGIEGSVFIAGAIIQWLRDGLRILDSADQSEEVALSVSDNGGIVVVPALSGLGAPYWDPYARGTIIGITRGTERGHIVRAAIESIAFQVKDVMDAMQSDFGKPIRELRVDGGASANNLLMQFQADILGIEVLRPEVMETTALGAAYMAGLATGFWENEAEIREQRNVSGHFTPSIDAKIRACYLENWDKALNRSRGWAGKREAERGK